MPEEKNIASHGDSGDQSGGQPVRRGGASDISTPANSETKGNISKSGSDSAVPEFAKHKPGDSHPTVLGQIQDELSKGFGLNK